MDTDVSIEGLILPNKSLTNFDLVDAAKKLDISNFRGVYCRTELPASSSRERNPPLTTECGIINLDDSSGNGTHWTAWYRKGDLKLYFDSYGIQPPLELIEYLKSPIHYNSDRVQPTGTVVCGHLCLYVLKRLSDGENFQVVINSLY